MRSPRRLFLTLLLALGLGALAQEPAAAARRFKKIRPGPAYQTDMERAMEADPSRGIEHAVILLEETDQNDAIGIINKTTYHLRAKILSNEARSLANVEIPLWTKEGSVKQWWGRTILPDGTVVELDENELKEQSLLRIGRRREARLLKAILPGVVPGAVIDYGYVIRDASRISWRRIPIQRRWFLREFRYRWSPDRRPGPFASACNLFRVEGLDVEAFREKASFVIFGYGIPPVVEEDWMPPDDEVRASAILYHTLYARSPQDFWNDLATAGEKLTGIFNRSRKPLREALAGMDLPEEGGLEAKVRRVYDWLHEEITNVELLSAEQMEASSNLSGLSTDRVAGDVLKDRRGRAGEIDFLFLGLARELGAEAWLVLAPDRTDHDWDPELMAWWGQFDEMLVAIRMPTDLPGHATFTDPGSGLEYGDIPWWVSGARALLVAEKDGRAIRLPEISPRRIVTETKARLELREGGGSAGVLWSRGGTGQQGLTELRRLRTLAPADRSRMLEQLCGSSGDFEVTRAEAPQLQDLTRGFSLECEGEILELTAAEGESAWSVSFGGPWIPGVPELTAAERVHPLFFPHPRIDLATVEVIAPPGSVPAATPDSVRVDGLFGNYFLRIDPTETGYSVQRSLTLPHRRLDADRYAGLRKFLEQVRRADRTRLLFR